MWIVILSYHPIRKMCNAGYQNAWRMLGFPVDRVHLYPICKCFVLQFYKAFFTDIWYIHNFSVTSTNKSSIKVKILIWSIWFFLQMITFYASFWQVLLKSSNLFFLHFYKAFFTYKTKNSHFLNHQPLNHPSIKVEILIWSTWFFQQVDVKLFYFTFMMYFLQLYETKNSHFLHNINH